MGTEGVNMKKVKSVILGLMILASASMASACNLGESSSDKNDPLGVKQGQVAPTTNVASTQTTNVQQSDVK